MRIFALGGIAAPVIFALVALIAGALRPDYSHVTHFISELGATGTAYAGLMNYAGFVPAGLLLAAFAVALGRLLPGGRTTIAAAALIGFFALCLTASGLISCDSGCPQGSGSLQNIVHNRMAPLMFLAAIAGIALLGVRLRRVPAWHAVSRYSLLTSAIALAFFLALASSLESRLLTGLWQRLMLATLFLWCAAIGPILASHGVARARA